ncbi:glycosyltransferase [Methylobacter psychrophilus]|uniref:glycosyltransferase n=1 Tax=Methylobacter psychrophilus TaxID=96941 RepID=UPI0021D4D7DA|nr:glycosyltransferase [Methylobacter psychrophilus]
MKLLIEGSHHMNSREPMDYVLITPARNEQEYIDMTIRSVISQTILPKRWIIVSDGSTDQTDDIVKQYLIIYPWMELIRMPEHSDRQFAAKVYSFRAGYERVKDIQFNIIGNLDADVCFEADYFEYLLGKFIENPQLGVAGTAFVEDSNIAYNYQLTNIEHVSGQCQIFRRCCFEEIGGYTPFKGGGIDWTAVTTARMKGWRTRTFTEKTFTHHRAMGTGNSSMLMAWFKRGRKDYFLGGHPLWQIFRSLYQMSKKPYFLGGALLLFGYLWAMVSREERSVSPELMQFHRHEQMQRLKNIVVRLFKLKILKKEAKSI